MPFGTWRAANQHYHIRNINIDHWLHSLIPPPLPPSFGFLFWLGVKCKSFALPLLVAMFGQGTALIICPLQLNVLKEWCAFLNCCPFSWPCVIQNIRGQWEWDLDSKGTEIGRGKSNAQRSVVIPESWACGISTQSFSPSPLGSWLQELLGVKAL